MGLCASSLTEEQKRERRKNLEIEAQQKKDSNAAVEVVKLLLLGAGESGKSTIFKQMKLLFGEHKSFQDEERLRYKLVVHGNAISAMKTLIRESFTYGDGATEAKTADDVNTAENENPDCSDWPEADKVFYHLSDTLDAEGASAIAKLWQQDKIQQTYAQRSKFQLEDSASYFLDKVEELAQPDYMPSNEDILRSRVRTSGIVEEKYEIEGVKFAMFDVGGQRNERKKWIHCFDDVTALIFVAALSAYDQVLYEDASMNRTVEAIDLFNEICQMRWFVETSIILFLNKKDLFEQKITKVNPTTVTTAAGRPFPDFDILRPQIESQFNGELSDYDYGCKYFERKFLEKNLQDDSRTVTPHCTCATDTENVRIVFETCREAILEENLQSAGFM